ncbi:hypothetical protein AAZV13_09G107300 [Glycine max]
MIQICHHEQVRTTTRFEELGANAILTVSRAGAAVLKVPLYMVFIHELWYLIISNENAKGENKKNSANTENISNDLQSNTHIFLNYLPSLLRIFPLLAYNWRRGEQNYLWEHYVLVTILGSRTFNIFLLFKFILCKFVSI